jgi:hypothetical protein
MLYPKMYGFVLAITGGRVDDTEYEQRMAGPFPRPDAAKRRSKSREGEPMSTTSWVGTTTDASLGSNWSDGLPDAVTINALLDSTSVVNLATGFGSIRSRGTLAGALQPADGDTVSFDDGGSDPQTYRFKNTTLAANDVKIGASVLATHDNLAAAVDGTGTGDGSDYHAGTSACATMVNVSTSATQSVYAAADGGTAGDAIAVSDVSVNWGWTGGTLSGGAANGAIMANIYIDAGYTGDIHTSGTKAQISCGEFFHRGTGTVYIEVANCTRMVCASPNYALAMDLQMLSSLTGLEIVRGRCKLNAPAGTALPTQILVCDTTGGSENLRLTGDTTLTGARLIVAPGRVSVDGPDWTALENFAGHLTIVDGAVTTLTSTGVTTLKATDTMTTAYIMGGDFDLTQGAGGKTVSTVWLAPQATFHRRDDIDTYTLNEIGRK